MRMHLCSTDKFCYPDAASAWARLCEIRAELRAEGRTYKVTRRCPRRIYQCPECGFWHMTSADQLRIKEKQT